MPRHKTRPLVIVNPAAAGGAAGREWAAAAATLRAHFGPFDRLFTKRSGDAFRIARRESDAGRSRLITFGGDGTISEVASGVMRSDRSPEIGFLPRGTGGDYLRSLGVPGRLADAAAVLRDGRILRVDVGSVCFSTRGNARARRFFVNSCSFGLSALVARRANRSSKSMGGKLTFASLTLGEALRHNAPHVGLKLDGGRQWRGAINTLVINNGRFFGGGMKIAPEAELSDGKLDAVIVARRSLGKFLLQGPLVYAGAHLALPEIQHARCRQGAAWAVRDDSVPIEVDGECPGTLPASFEVHPAALRVCVPRTPSFRFRPSR